MEHDNFAFRNGDRVIALEGGLYPFLAGKTGTVVGHFSDIIHVDWDEESLRFHSCNGEARMYHGWDVPRKSIEHYHEVEFELPELSGLFV